MIDSDEQWGKSDYVPFGIYYPSFCPTLDSSVPASRQALEHDYSIESSFDNGQSPQ